MDKKAVQILNRLMDDRKKHSVSAEDLAYARKMGVVVEDQPITHDQALDLLERCFEAASLENAAQAFLYSLSSRDVDYRYVLASYVYARSWFSFDRGQTEEIPEKLTGTFFNWVKHKGGGIWGTIGKPIFYLEQFASMERRVPSDADVEILRLILELADSMEDKASGDRYPHREVVSLQPGRGRWNRRDSGDLRDSRGARAPWFSAFIHSPTGTRHRRPPAEPVVSLELVARG